MSSPSFSAKPVVRVKKKLALKKKKEKKKERILLTNFIKLSNGCFLINYGEPLNEQISKLKYFPNSLDIKI